MNLKKYLFPLLIVSLCVLTFGLTKVKISKVTTYGVEKAPAIVLDKLYDRKKNMYALVCYDITNREVYEINRKEIWDKAEIKDSIIVTFHQNKISKFYDFLDIKVLGKSKQKLDFKIK